MPKMISVSVTTMDAELQFTVQSNTTGNDLFEQIVKTIGLRETWYFSLVYVDIKGNRCWVNLHKKIFSLKVKDKYSMEFQFLVKFYPEDVADELIQDITIKFFYLQVRESILRSEIFCPPETALLLASLECQVKFGDYDPLIHKAGYLTYERILPQRIINQHQWSILQWEERITKWFVEHNGLFREEAMLEYLKIAQDLEMYGVSYFQIKNKKHSNLYLGVDALGLNVYKYADKLTPQVGFPWNEIRNISFKDKKFVIKSVDKKAPDFMFFTETLNINKNILSLCAGNHDLYIRRKLEDSIAVQQMKAQAHEDKIAKKTERERLLREKDAREKAEKKLIEIEKLLKKEELEHSLTNKAMESYRDSVELMRQRLESNRHVEPGENKEIVLNEKVNHEQKHSHGNEIYQKLLTENMTEKIQEEEIKTIIMRKKSNVTVKAEELHAPVMNNCVLETTEIEYINVPKECKAKEVKVFGHDFAVLENGDCNSSVENRKTIIELDKSLQNRLQGLEDELKVVRHNNVLDEVDTIHEKNKSMGMDKFKTLRQIRLGNTKRRIDAFEAM